MDTVRRRIGGTAEAEVFGRRLSPRFDPAKIVEESSAAYGSSSGRVRKIGFIGVSSGAGTTTVAQAAASCIAALDRRRNGLHRITKRSGTKEKGFFGKEGAQTAASREEGRLTALVELPLYGRPLRAMPEGFRGSASQKRPLPYDKAGIDRHFAGREYADIHAIAAEGKPVGGIMNISGGVNWVLIPPDRAAAGREAGDGAEALTVADLVRLSDEVEGGIAICDIEPFQGFDMRELRSLLASMHRICCIIDPLPSRLLACSDIYETVSELEAAGNSTVYVLNRSNPGVIRKEVKRFLGLGEWIDIPALPAEALCRAEYSCGSVYGLDPGYDKAMAGLIDALMA
jgi:hypothetical protein